MLKRLLLLIVLVTASGCGDWIEKLAPEETTFARHSFDLLQHRDFAAIETISAPRLRDADLAAHLSEMAALIPAETPISSEAVNVNVSTANGYTTSKVGMTYQFQSGWLEFDVAAEGPSGGAKKITSITLQPTTAPTAALSMMPVSLVIPPLVIVLVLIGVVVYRRRARAREALETPAATHERRHEWSTQIEDAAARTPWFCRLLGIRRIDLSSPLGPEECKGRLRASMAAEFTLFRWGSGPRSDFQGWVGNSRFRFTRKQSIFFSSKFQTFLYGSLAPDGAGTRLNCSLGPQRLLFGILGAFLLFLWVGFPTMVIGNGFSPLTLLSLLGPFLMTAFIAAGFAANRRRVLKEGPVLVDFLSQTLDATPAHAHRSGSIERIVRR